MARMREATEGRPVGGVSRRVPRLNEAALWESGWVEWCGSGWSCVPLYKGVGLLWCLAIVFIF